MKIKWEENQLPRIKNFLSNQVLRRANTVHLWCSFFSVEYVHFSEQILEFTAFISTIILDLDFWVLQTLKNKSKNEIFNWNEQLKQNKKEGVRLHLYTYQNRFEKEQNYSDSHKQK